MTNNPLANLSVQQLKHAVAIRQKIQALQKQLDQIVSTQASATKNAAPKKKRRISAAGRARISKAAKARWAKIRARKGKK